MGHLLKDVIYLKEEGLTGFLETGEDVHLSAPNPKFSYIARKESLVKDSGEEVYIQFGEEDKRWGIVPYNVYTKRE